MKVNLLMINMMPWGAPSAWIQHFQKFFPRLKRIWPPNLANRNTYIAEQLIKDARMQRVLLIDQPPISLKKAMKVVLSSGFGRLKTIQANRVFEYSSPLPAISRSLWLNRINNMISKLQMEDNLMLWSYHPMFPEIFEQIRARVKIFDCVDDWGTHPSYARYQEFINRSYQRIGASSDLVFSVSPSILAERFAKHPRASWIPNGVDLEAFLRPAFIQLPFFANVHHPVIGYLGVIQNRLDIDLLDRVISEHGDKTFVFVGTIWPDAHIEVLRKYPNVKFLGPIPREHVPSTLREFDVAIIPHKMNAFTASMNPLKIYEYLAAGKSIVATPVAGLEPFQNLVVLAKNADQFSKGINKALSEDSKEHREKRQTSMRVHTWEQRVQTMMQKIEPFFAKN